MVYINSIIDLIVEICSISYGNYLQINSSVYIGILSSAIVQISPIESNLLYTLIIILTLSAIYCQLYLGW